MTLASHTSRFVSKEKGYISTMEKDVKQVLIAGHELVLKLLSMRDCIDVMESMFRTLASGHIVLPLRTILIQPDKKGALALMPAYVGDPNPVTGAKIITVFPENLNTRYESHQGCVLLFECKNGRLLAIIDAGAVTAIRTAAASAVATRLLARKESTNLAILGSGAQASTHLESMLEVRSIERVKVWSRKKDHADRFVRKHANLDRLLIESVDSAAEAIKGADIICTTTASSDPILKGEWLKPGTHINAVGASRPESRELDSNALGQCRIYTDRMESLLNESGDYLIPKSEGVIKDGSVVGEIGELLLGKILGRKEENEITLFKSLGIASEDLTTASHIYEKALATKTGTWIEFSGIRTN